MSDGTARHALRHPRRRDGSEVPAPRERDRAVVRRERRPLREPVDAQRLRQRRRRRRCRSRSATSSRVREVLPRAASSGSAAVLRAREPLPRADQLLARAARAGGRRARPHVHARCATCRRRRAVAGEHSSASTTAMDDDFNTPEAMAVLQTHAARDELPPAMRATRRAVAAARAELRVAGRRARAAQLRAGVVVQECRPPPRRSCRSAGGEGGRAPPGSPPLSDAEVEARIARACRGPARPGTSRSRTDIREELAAAGVVLEDKPGRQDACGAAPE